MGNKDCLVWATLYQEFADELRKYKNDRITLRAKIKNVFNNIGMELPKLENDNNITDVCPFTVFGLFNKGLTDTNRIKIVEGFAKEFNLKSLIPTNFNGIPVLNNMNAAFYYLGDGGGEHNIDNLWDVFVCALDYADDETQENKEKFIASWNKVIKQIGIKWDLTIGLYWIRPFTFLSLDDKNRNFIVLEGLMPQEYISEIGKLNTIISCEDYLRIIELIKRVIEENGCEFKNFIELSYKAWTYNESKTKESSHSVKQDNKRYDDEKWWPSKEEYDPELNKEDRIKLLNDNKIFDENSLILMKCILDYGGIASCKELSEKYGRNSGFYNIVTSKLGKRIINKEHIKEPNPNLPYSKYWPVLFVGQYSLSRSGYLYKLRDELKEALMECDLSLINVYEEKQPRDDDRNYFWLNANPKIFSFNELENNETIVFTLKNEKGNPRRKQECFDKAKKGDFVFGYEATPSKSIVALCEVSRESDGESIEFKKIASLDEKISYNEIQQYEELKDLEILKPAPYGTLFDITKDEYDFLFCLIEDKNKTKYEFTKYAKDDFLKDVFISSKDYDKLYSLIKHKHNIILQGAPGVGKTFLSKRFAYSVLGEIKDTNIAMVQFHQNYTYEDFVMGYKPNENGFKLEPGVFYNFVKLAKNHPNEDFFFIIDEINRGNLSKIFGELLMLIEHDYRDKAIKLSYNEEEFSVPSNLYIIGMMNTADRSLSLIDYALRRRFSFVNLIPAFDNETFIEYQKEVNNSVFDNLIKVIKSLNEEIMSRLGKGFVIGHSYFVKSNPNEITTGYLKEVVEFDLIPLLEEYFFDETDDVVSKWAKRLYEALDEE